MSTKEFKWDMEIPIDLTLHGEVTEKGLRFKTRYYGMKRGEFLILHMPGAPQIREHLFKRENLIMRFMHAGTVYGFMTQVLAHSLLPAPIFFVKFPKYLETINLRKHQRVDTFLKARMQVGQEIQKGVILDISATGCRFSIDKGKNSSWSPLEPKTPIRLEFRLADNSDPHPHARIGCIVLPGSGKRDVWCVVCPGKQASGGAAAH